MPREKDPKKYIFAKSLLAADHSIQEIRDKLENIFGSSISPNTLIEMKKELKLIQQEKEGSKSLTFKSIFGGKSTPKRDEDLLHSLMYKLDVVLDSQAILIQNFFDKFETGTDLLNVKMDNLKKGFDDSQYKIIQRIQTTLLALIKKEPRSISYLSKHLMVSPNLIEYILDNLIEKKEIVEIKKNEHILYKIASKIEESLEIPINFEQDFRINRLEAIIVNQLEQKPMTAKELSYNLKGSYNLIQILLTHMLHERTIQIENTSGTRRIFGSLNENQKFESSQQIEGIYDEMMHFLTPRFGQQNTITERFETSPDTIIKVLLKIAEKWPFNCIKYQLDSNEEEQIDFQQEKEVEEESDFTKAFHEF